MRIISGQFRGRKLHSLKHNDLRPTTNKIREKLFNILEHNKQILKKDSLNDVELLLDICCGLGSIGFEALSRGVKKVTMIDKNPIFGDLVHLNASNLKVMLY